MTQEVTVGTRGPIPKPAATRRRVNKPAMPVKKAPRGASATPTKKKAAKADPVLPTPRVRIPDEDPNWEPLALGLWRAMANSGQSEFYEESDWAYAKIVVESMSRDLAPQVVGFTPTGEILRSRIPLKGNSMSGYRAACAVLGVTEGDRRRLLIELERGAQVDPDQERANATITDLKSRLKRA